MIVLPIRNVNQAMFALKIPASPTFKFSKCEHAYTSKIYNCTGISATYIVCKLFRSRSIIWLMELQEDVIFIYLKKKKIIWIKMVLQLRISEVSQIRKNIFIIK